VHDGRGALIFDLPGLNALDLPGMDFDRDLPGAGELQ